MPPARLPDLARKIKTEHRAVRKYTEDAVRHARKAGQFLIAAKHQLRQHGAWLPWLRDHCSIAPRTAQAYMRLARLSQQEAQRVAHLPLREVLQAVATPKPQLATGSKRLVFSDEQIIDSAFGHFRKRGFPYREVPIHVAMQALNRLAATDSRALLSSPVGYDVADSYHRHRFRATARGHLSPVQGFECDKLLRRALRKELETGNVIPTGYFGGLSIVSGVQPCSNFRPGIACHYYKRFSPTNGVVLDTSTGYGGRLVGFMASGCAGRYIGIDPNPETHAANLRLAEDLGFADKVELHCLPVEDVSVEVVRDRCDFALTSPPYFTKEHYSHDPTQSWLRYPTPEAWCEGFLRPMLRLQFEALKSGAVSVINVDDVLIKGVHHAVSEWTKTLAAEVGFKLVDVERLKFPPVYWAATQNLDTSEPVFIFRKP